MGSLVLVAGSCVCSGVACDDCGDQPHGYLADHHVPYCFRLDGLGVVFHVRHDHQSRKRSGWNPVDHGQGRSIAERYRVAQLGGSKDCAPQRIGAAIRPSSFSCLTPVVNELVMLVLDDPEDPTPYWLVSSKNPEALLRAFLPGQADHAIKDLEN